MLTVYLNRFKGSDQGTPGVFFCPDLFFSCFSFELPWRDNKGGFSCIPTGESIVKIRWSRKYKWHFHVTDVEGRTWILLHSGNFAGDTSKGYKTHTLGCILLGQKRGYLGGQRAVLLSRHTVRKFMNLMKNQTFKLIIS